MIDDETPRGRKGVNAILAQIDFMPRKSRASPTPKVYGAVKNVSVRSISKHRARTRWQKSRKNGYFLLAQTLLPQRHALAPGFCNFF